MPMLESKPNKYYTLLGLNNSYKSGDITASEIVEYFISNIQKFDPKIKAFQTIYHKSALDAGKACDLAFSSGDRIGPFHGVPFVLKDICELKGKITTGGSAVNIRRKSKETAVVAKRLLSAGGILLGKTKTVEFAFGGWGTNQRMGTPKNPWDNKNHRVCGGSSAGSAAALAADMAICAIGTDTGGSVRLPAAFCGLAGLKVTKDLLPTDGIIPLSHTLDTPGPMARTLMDMTIMFEVLRGADGQKIDQDIRKNRGIFKFLTKSVKGLKVGSINDTDRKMCSSEVLHCYDKALLALESQGAVINLYDPPIAYSEISSRMSNIIASEAYYHHGHLYDDMQSPMDEDVRARVLSAKTVDTCTYIDLLEGRKKAEKVFFDSMQKFDVLVTPTVSDEAPIVSRVDQSISPGHFTRPFNYVGMCALSIQMGLSKIGLPLGLQVVARPNSEALAIQVGAAVERMTQPIF